MCAMCSSAATPPRLCWTGQLTEQVLTARSCTCTAQQATSCVAARMGSGGTLSTIIKARRCDRPPDVCAPRQLSAMALQTGVESEILDLCARILRETDARLDAKRGTSDQRAHPGGMLQLAFFAAKQDPVAYREGLLGHSPRALAVLLLAAKKQVGITTSRGAWPRDFGTIRIRKLH